MGQMATSLRTVKTAGEPDELKPLRRLIVTDAAWPDFKPYHVVKSRLGLTSRLNLQRP